MNKVPRYLKSIVNTLQNGDDGILKHYSATWLDEWLNVSKIREKYGEDWKKNYTAVANHSKAVGYMEAVGALYLYKLKQFPEITIDKEIKASQETN